MPEVLKNKNFLYLYVAGFTSELGSFALNNALLLYIFKLSDNNPAYMGISQATFIGFFILGSLIGGPIAEKKDKKNVLLTCEYIRIPVLIGFFFTENLVLIFLLKGIIAFFTGIFNPSRMAFINYIVDKDNINQANSIFGTTFAILHILGPILGTQIYTLTGGVDALIYLDLISYALGIILLLKINHRFNPEESMKSKFFPELIEGISYVKKNKDLLSILMFVISIGTCIGILVALFLPFTTEVLNQPPSFYGYIISSFGLGGLLGGLVSHLLSKKLTLGKIIIFSLLSEVTLMFVWISIKIPLLSLVVLFIWGILVFTRITSQLNYVSKYVDKSFLTRVHSLLDMSINVPQILGGVLIGFIGAATPVLSILHVNAFLFLALFILITIQKGTKQLFHKK